MDEVPHNENVTIHETVHEKQMNGSDRYVELRPHLTRYVEEELKASRES